ncbi:glycosyltransferase family 4 protein [Streptomyces sp. NBC_01335]|uniref:glycosyltransferase family 4 protein n=1 Tax=Streptomyces sp. NBC_01335 TaxID=2903828 RepID=UPI002E0D2221|nr:glycosyltransferase family 4 protein [Streptomyces sp. NBC_01335]
MKISFLIHNAYGIGGTISTTFNLAHALAERHEVEIVSVNRHREVPAFTLDPRIRLRPLIDLRREKDHPLFGQPSKAFPRAENRYGQYNALTDRRIAEFLTGTDADVAIGTRAGLNVHLALQAPDRTVRVGQEHLTVESHPPALRRVLRRAYRRLDALTTVSDADADAYRRTMRLPGVRVEALPNSVPDPVLPPADGNARIVVAAGRLVRVKRYDLLIEAFAKVAAERPDWQLRIYGRGEEHDRLRRLVDELALHNNVFLMGAAAPMEAEWVKGSIAAATSSFEPFGMTIVEAMRCGLPVVSTDCPHGPAEIIRPGEDGRLVPVGNRDALAAALLDLVRDDELRRRMGRAALDNSRRYAPGPVVARAEALFEGLATARTTGRPAAPDTGTALALGPRGYAARDTLEAGARTLLKTVRKAKRR